MDNPSYSGTDRPGTVKSNPTYLEEPSASDMESMSVSMTLSAEDLISQVDTQLFPSSLCYSKTYLKWPLKIRQNKGLNDKW